MAEQKQNNFIKTEKHKNILHIIFNRPRDRNVFNWEMLIKLSDAFTELEKDNGILAGLIYANGKHFTLGLELDDIAKNIKTEHRLPLPDGNIDPFGLYGPERTKPVICAVHGMCFTLGIELLLNTEIALAAPRTIFSQMEVSRGVFPFGGGTMRWVDAVGYGNAMRYLLTGDTFSSDEALRMGLIQEIVPLNKLTERAAELGEKIANQAPLAVRDTITSSRFYIKKGWKASVKDLQIKLNKIIKTSDFEEGIQSLEERRKGLFKGV
jgi:enoyl-CoA hydratase/carnithine racemase